MPVGAARCAALACAVAIAGLQPVHAQDTVPPRPTPAVAAGGRAASDTGDTLAARLTAADTIKAPLARSYAPPVVGARGVTLHWTRDDVYADGSLTLGELLRRIPGVTLMTSGFLMAPSVPAWHGDPGAVRLFIDGVEREEVTPRNGGVTDFALVPLWALEDVTVEETPGELRVHARTWRVDRTTASTRTDVITGSDNLNLFRGYFGKRAANGLAVQLAAQQASTVSLPGMDGTALGAMGRLGWAAGPWSVDATLLRQGIDRTKGTRNLFTTTPDANAMPAYKGAASTSYLRAAWRSPVDSGAWVQLVAGSVGAGLEAPVTTTAADTARADTSVTQRQYTVLGGFNRGALRVSGGARVRGFDGRTNVAPVARLDAERWGGTLSLAAERRHSGALTWDARAQANPYDWLRVSGTVGAWQSSAGAKATPGYAGDVAVRVRDRWIGAGVVHVGARTVLPPVEFDTTVRVTGSAAGSAVKITVAGPLARGWNLQLDATNWDAAAPLRPQTEVNTRLWFDSRFLKYAPRGNFNVYAALSHEYRSRLFVPRGEDPLAQVADAYSVYSTLIEIRISTAAIYWDYRNMVGTRYETFPGYLMPRILNVYGVRWEFWN